MPKVPLESEGRVDPSAGPSQRGQKSGDLPSECQGLSCLGREGLEGVCEPEIRVYSRQHLWSPQAGKEKGEGSGQP